MQSMTGFGRGEATSELFVASVELSSVNRKQAEVSVNIQRDLSELEIPLRKQILSKVSRGRINASITLTSANNTSEALTVDLQKALALEEQFKLLSSHIGRDVSLTPADFLRTPGVLMSAKIESQAVLPLITSATELALSDLIMMREREGLDLLKDCRERLNSLSELLTKISQKAPEVLTTYRDTLISKLEDAELPLALADLMEDERIIKEIALFADRSDISEEITRLLSHLDKFHDYLSLKKPIGRSLDFLCQEMNREFNTIGAKANNASLAHLIVTGKTEVEKIREQVQNIE